MVDYAHSMGEIKENYKQADGRINKVWSFPVVGYIVAPVAIAVAVVAVAVAKKRSRSK